MKKILDARKLLGIDKEAGVKELKTLYRTLMKDHHPDLAQEHAKQEAEEKSKAVIDAYHLLVSVAPETHEAQREQYTAVITASRILDFEYKAQTLLITFADSSRYEYFGVPHNVYNKFLNSSTPDRFARRHLYHEYLYRKVNKAAEK